MRIIVILGLKISFFFSIRYIFYTSFGPRDLVDLHKAKQIMILIVLIKNRSE